MYKVIQSRINRLEKDLNDVVAAGGEIEEIFDSNKSDDDYLIVAKMPNASGEGQS